MPFTFAHPAIVLSFGIKKTKYLDLTALVIGSMAPDFEYFIYFNLPIVFIVAYIYQCILKEVVTMINGGITAILFLVKSIVKKSK